MDKNAVSEAVFNIVHSYKHAIRGELQAQNIALNGMHVRCLSFIDKRKQCTANDIVQHFARDKAQVARLVKEMISNDWLVKSPNPEDKRSQLLSLTEQGIALSQQISNAQQKIQDKMQQDLSEQELEMFVTVMDKLARNLIR
ncbi:MarR family winged helix-turn-helix transcriptional regulator [Vibrio ezurae]|uniref:Putative MarR family transcriptional protein n=1 Tax=Vibrio ezurae NBRC 102218 TaxID=1219080 RepID=U3B415_9VIBR|nr:MarR family winged helix-turn-helix transcriptional regulator [Vibrio ezurae]GAD80197.1 putative MarR family transcriptional protein [Vibrio ezurae NBRC 102218]